MITAINGDRFSISSIPCCGDEAIVDALDEAGIGWSSGLLRTEAIETNEVPVLLVLREPTSWYREYIMDVPKGLGEFHELDGEIMTVFDQLATEPEVALNISAVNLCAKQPGWLSRLYKMYELTLIPVWKRTAVMDYKDIGNGVKDFLLSAGVDGAENMTDEIELGVDGEELPELFPKTLLDLRREESRAYDEFGVLLNW
jgi:hypothetical protein|tara:strand:- start:20425 stop:21024 length:600 start_codon:yes stop_codon:yes gene_type:complete